MLLPTGEPSAEFTTLFLIAFLMAIPLPWIRIPPMITLIFAGGGMILGILVFQLSLRSLPIMMIAILQAFLVVFVAALPLTWSRITAIMTFLALTGASLIDASGEMLLWRGAFLWFFGGMSALLLTLSMSARYIAPPFNQERNKTSFLSFRLLLRSLFSELKSRYRPIRHSPRVARSFSTIKAGDVPSHQAYAVYRGPRYYAAIGPGYTLLNGRVRINEVYDVRPHRYVSPIKAATRDGIAIESEIYVTFSVQRPAGPPDSHFPFRYRRAAIGRLKPTMVTQADGTEYAIHPYQQVAPRGAMITVEEISRRTLNQLMQLPAENDETGSSLITVETLVKEKLNIFFKDRGLSIEAVEILPFKLPDNVLDARLGEWKGKWKKLAGERWMGRGVRKVSPAVAEAQLSVIKDLLDSLQVYKEVGNTQLSPDLPGYDQIMEQIEQVILDATAEGVMRAMFPEGKDG